MTLTETEQQAIDHYDAFMTHFINNTNMPQDTARVISATLAAAALTAERMERIIDNVSSVANYAAGPG